MEMGFCVEKGGGGNRHWVAGVLCAKLKLHKITPNTQGIRRYDVMISGEVQSLALPLIPKEVEQIHKYKVCGSCRITHIHRDCCGGRRAEEPAKSGVGFTDSSSNSRSNKHKERSHSPPNNAQWITGGV